MTKYQIAYRAWRTDSEIVEIHHARCRDIDWSKNRKAGALVDAANPFGAAVDAWSHKKPGGDRLVFERTEFYPCLGAAPAAVEVPTFGLRDSLETKIDGTTDWAEEHGWEVKDLGQSLELSREDEFLVCAWDGNRWDGTLSAWTFDGRTVRMPSHLDALRRIAGHPEDVPEAPEGRKKPVKKPTMRNVPFNLDDPEVEILVVVNGQKLVWVNSLTGEEESARVMLGGRQTRIHESSAGRRILTFCDADGTGYRSVALDALVAVK